MHLFKWSCVITDFILCHAGWLWYSTTKYNISLLESCQDATWTQW